MDPDLVAEAREKFEHAERHEHFQNSSNKLHLFETLEDKENLTKVVVDSWLHVSGRYPFSLYLPLNHARTQPMSEGLRSSRS